MPLADAPGGAGPASPPAMAPGEVKAGNAGSGRFGLSPEASRAARRFVVILAVVSVLFGTFWERLVRDALKDALHSYAVAIPVISAWLVSQDRRVLAGVSLRRSTGLALGLMFGSLAAGLGAWMVASEGQGWSLTLGMAGWVLGVWAGLAWGLGWEWIRRTAFAVGFLAFAVPLPEPAVVGIERILQHSTAAVVELAFRATNVTYARDARAFWLPGLRFEVAQECSGIRSTLVLFITSLVGAKLLLVSQSRRLLLALSVIPLGIARNAFRIWVITLLTVHVNPKIIDSPLHHQGGPLFFVLSLVPLLLLFWWFRRQETSMAVRSSRPPS